MKCCVTTFRVRNGLGVQSVTGIVDRFGEAFTPEHIFLINGSSLLETLWSNLSDPYSNAASANTNTYNVATNQSAYWGTANQPVLLFDLNTSSAGGGTGPPAFLDSLHSQLAAAGRIYRQAGIISVYNGGFDLQVLTEDVTVLTDVMVMVLGSDSNDFHMEILPGDNLFHTYTFGFKPTGIINPKTPLPSSTGGVATGANSAWGWGWDSISGGAMSSHIAMGDQTQGNYKYQSHLSYDNGIGIGTPFVATDVAHVTSWDVNGVTLNMYPNASHRGYAIGGTGIITASGTFTQRSTVGTQVINAGVHAMALFVMSVGSVPSTVLQTNNAEYCFAWANGVNQNSIWFGEKATSPPTLGGVYMSEISLLRFASGGPNGPSTVFTSIANLVEINRNGTFTINWTTNDGIGREIIWFAIGAAPNTLPPTAVLKSGLYFINPDNKTHDSYNGGVEKKIPNPTIKTSLLGS